MSAIDNESRSRLDLIVEPLGSVAQRRDAAELAVLGLGEGVQTLYVDTEPARLRFVAAPRTQRLDSRALAFESLTLDGRASLLMQCPAGLRVRINGSPAGRLSVLNAGDELQLDDAVLHLVEFVQFYLGPPPEEQIGLPCVICRTPISPDTRIYLHRCGAPFHLESESTPADQRLECALVTDTCPDCDRDISMQTGHEELPEL